MSKGPRRPFLPSLKAVAPTQVSWTICDVCTLKITPEYRTHLRRRRCRRREQRAPKTEREGERGAAAAVIYKVGQVFADYIFIDMESLVEPKEKGTPLSL